MAVVTMARKKPAFAKVFPRGWQSLREIGENSLALKLYTFFAEHSDHLNALVCPVDVLAEEFQVHERTVRRAAKWLEERGHIVIIRVGTANAFVINPEELWKNLDKYKGYCAFSSKTLARKDATLRKRLTLMLQKQPDLFSEEEEEDDQK